MKTTLTDVEYGKNVVEIEANAVKNLIHHIDDNFQNAVDLVINCRGRIVVTGIGKAGIMGQKISATLASISHSFLLAAFSEAEHGEIGRKRLPVDTIIRRDEEYPIANEDVTVTDALKIMTSTNGNPGAVNIIEINNKLAGFFTDGNLRRNLRKGTSLSQ